jgi:FtsX-like permease family
MRGPCKDLGGKDRAPDLLQSRIARDRSRACSSDRMRERRDVAFGQRYLKTKGVRPIRLALGAPPVQIVRQQALEGLLVALPAACIGLALAVLVIKLVKMAPDSYYRRILIDWNLFRFAAGVSLVTPTIFAILPALRLLSRRTALTTGAWVEAESGSDRTPTSADSCRNAARGCAHAAHRLVIGPAITGRIGTG